jgi:hypothetical protein
MERRGFGFINTRTLGRCAESGLKMERVQRNKSLENAGVRMHGMDVEA